MGRPMMRAALVAISPVLLSVVIVGPATTAHAADPNSFNRLHTSQGNRNAPPARDGIHDPAVDGTAVLQHPKQAFEGLPKANGGNYVNWVEALKSGKISPRYDKGDETVKPTLLNLDIVREVKGTMPDVVYPHAEHTEWIDCPTCHPAIFTPAKGANTMTMTEIMLGEKCGVCHGTVAFPVTECRRCHNEPKTPGEKKASRDGGQAEHAAARKGGRRFRLPW